MNMEQSFVRLPHISFKGGKKSPIYLGNIHHNPGCHNDQLTDI